MTDKAAAAPDPQVEGATERKGSLEKHLQQRPTKEQLQDRGILYQTDAAPALQQAAHDLERQRTADSLNQKLKDRPAVSKLIRDGIMSSEEDPTQK